MTTPTPAKKVPIILSNKDGTSVQYRNVTFFPKTLMLLFNGNNSSVSINQDKIESVSIENKKYLIKESELTDNEIWAIKLWRDSI